MLKAFMRCLIVGASTLCVAQVFDATAQAQVASPPADMPANQSTSALFPLESRTFEIEETVNFDTVSESINNRTGRDSSAERKADELDMRSVPIIGELLDDEGNFDWGVDLPVSFNVGNVMGQTGLVLGADFPVN
ncbi:MAG: hypothetical protein WBD47_10485 [Phormidesmis sp.]